MIIFLTWFQKTHRIAAQKTLKFWLITIKYTNFFWLGTFCLRKPRNATHPCESSAFITRKFQRKQLYLCRRVCPPPRLFSEDVSSSSAYFYRKCQESSFNHLNEAISRSVGVTVTLPGWKSAINTRSSLEDRAAFTGEIQAFDLVRVNKGLQVRWRYLCALWVLAGIISRSLSQNLQLISLFVGNVFVKCAPLNSWPIL